MKKFYAFLAAALISVCAFASREEVPSNAVLANYYEQGQVCVCIYVPEELKCYDIVFVGTYNDWNSSTDACAKFEPVENYDGWYVVAVDDDGLPEDPEKEPYADIEGKPVQLDPNGLFFWDFQIGAATWVSGGAQIVEGGVKGEIDIKEYGTDAPNVYTVDAWKKDPCSVVYNSYKVAVINDGCDGFAVPFIIGSPWNWNDGGFKQMQVDVEKTTELGAGYYYMTFQAMAGAEFQIVSGLMNAEGAIEVEPAWADEAYMQELVDDSWGRINNGGNFVLGEEAEIVFDLRVDTLRWARCAPAEPEEYVVIGIKLPAENRPEAVEIIGTFDDWAGTSMELLETGYHFATFNAKASQFFKVRGAGSWDQELEIYNAENDEWAKIGDNQMVFSKLWSDDTYKGNPCKWIELDWSSDAYRWTTAEQGIENVVLTEKAQKIVVDGVIYIVRDNKMFTIQGAQVR